MSITLKTCPPVGRRLAVHITMSWLYIGSMSEGMAVWSAHSPSANVCTGGGIGRDASRACFESCCVNGSGRAAYRNSRAERL
jgi:hypothetical protein